MDFRPVADQDVVRSFTAALLANLGELDADGSAGVDDSPLAQIRDTFSRYDEKTLEDGRKLRRYDNGSVRLINSRSGVIQEERSNGNLLVSLPTGRVIFQEQPGFPVLVFNNQLEGSAPLLGKIVLVKLGDAAEARPAFHFEDEQGGHFVDMDSLRYLRIAARPALALAA